MFCFLFFCSLNAFVYNGFSGISLSQQTVKQWDFLSVFLRVRADSVMCNQEHVISST